MAITVYNVASMTHGGTKIVGGRRFTWVATSESLRIIKGTAQHFKDRGYAIRLYKVFNKAMKLAGDNPEYFLFVRKK